MSLVELPANNGTIFAVDPHHVTGVQAYSSTLPGRTGIHDMSAVWLDNHNVFVCAWSVEHTLRVLNEERKRDFATFTAGYNAGLEVNTDHPDYQTMSYADRVKAAYIDWRKPEEQSA